MASAYASGFAQASGSAVATAVREMKERITALEKCMVQELEAGLRGNKKCI